MKRTLTLALTVALLGGLMFAGFAGTAAAGDSQSNDASVEQGQAISQSADASSDDSWAIAVDLDDDGDDDDTIANTGHEVTQNSDNTQDAEVNQGNENVEDSAFFTIDLDLA